MDQERLKKAKEYQVIRQKLSVLGLISTPLLLAAVGMTPVSSWLRNLAVEMHASPMMIVICYFFLFSLTMLIYDGPMAYFSGYILEQRYGLSNHTSKTWFIDFAKKSILSFAFSALLIVILYQIVWRYPNDWWVIAWAGFIFVSVVMGKIFPVFIVPIFYKYGPVTRAELCERIHRLAQKCSLPIENIFSLNLSKTTKKANAAFMGMGKGKRVVLSDTLLENFTDDEIEMVLAHELGHYKHRDILRQLSLGSFLSLIVFFIASRSVDILAQFFNYSGIEDVAAMPVLFLVFYAAYLFLTPLQNAFSRKMERAADRFALTLIAAPQVFISCMEKLSQVNLSDPDPQPLYEWFFYDHPSIGKRIKMAREEYLNA